MIKTHKKREHSGVCALLFRDHAEMAGIIILSEINFNTFGNHHDNSIANHHNVITMTVVKYKKNPTYNLPTMQARWMNNTTMQVEWTGYTVFSSNSSKPLHTHTHDHVSHVCPVICCRVKITTGTISVAINLCHKNIFTPKRMWYMTENFLSLWLWSVTTVLQHYVILFEISTICAIYFTFREVKVPHHNNLTKENKSFLFVLFQSLKIRIQPQ